MIRWIYGDNCFQLLSKEVETALSKFGAENFQTQETGVSNSLEMKLNTKRKTSLSELANFFIIYSAEFSHFLHLLLESKLMEEDKDRVSGFCFFYKYYYPWD